MLRAIKQTLKSIGPELKRQCDWAREKQTLEKLGFVINLILWPMAGALLGIITSIGLIALANKLPGISIPRQGLIISNIFFSIAWLYLLIRIYLEERGDLVELDNNGKVITE